MFFLFKEKIKILMQNPVRFNEIFISKKYDSNFNFSDAEIKVIFFDFF